MTVVGVGKIVWSSEAPYLSGDPEAVRRVQDVLDRFPKLISGRHGVVIVDKRDPVAVQAAACIGGDRY